MTFRWSSRKTISRIVTGVLVGGSVDSDITAVDWMPPGTKISADESSEEASPDLLSFEDWDRSGRVQSGGNGDVSVAVTCMVWQSPLASAELRPL